MNSKRFLIIGGIFIIVLCLVLWFVTKRGAKQPASPTTTATVTLPRPSLPAGIEGKEAVSYVVPTIKEKFPASLPVYSIKTVGSVLDKARVAARGLGFTTGPETVKTPNGNLYLWGKENGDFLAQENPPSFTFSLPPGAAGTFLQTPETAIVQRATAFLSSVRVPPEGITLSSPVVSYLIPSPSEFIYADRSSARAVEVKFSLLVDGYPVLAGHPDESFVVLRYDAGGNLFNFSSPVLPEVTKTETVSRLLAMQEASSLLVSGGGRLVSLYSDADKNQLTDVSSYLFSQATITDVSLAVFFAPEQRALLPIFVFRGAATEKQTGKLVQTTTLLSAGR